MIDRGISEEYVALWLDEADAWMRVRLEQLVNSARTVAHYGAAGRSLNQIYEQVLFRTGPVIAAEYLRRALRELAEPTPIDDSLPPLDSPVWEWVYRSQLGLVRSAF